MPQICPQALPFGLNPQKMALAVMYEDQGTPVEAKPKENLKALAAHKNGLLGVNAPGGSSNLFEQ